MVVTADALHTQRPHAQRVTVAGGHYLVVVEGNQKKLRKQLTKLPCARSRCSTAPRPPATAAARSAA
jgi:hypothetical protein